jgi:hypothetical protein
LPGAIFRLKAEATSVRSALLLQLTERAPLSFVGRAARPRLQKRSHQFRHLPRLDLLWRRRRRDVLVKRARVSLRDMTIRKRLDDDPLAAAERPLYRERVAEMDLAMRLRRLIVDVDSTALARLLGFGARAEQAGDVEPDVEADCIHQLIVEYDYRPSEECCVQFDPAASEEAPLLKPLREGLPKAFRMRHGRHYVEQLMGDAPLRTVREIAVADFHSVPESDADLSTLAVEGTRIRPALIVEM